jgi:hypothetical protein
VPKAMLQLIAVVPAAATAQLSMLVVQIVSANYAQKDPLFVMSVSFRCGLLYIKQA